jgi:hypothetical protein
MRMLHSVGFGGRSGSEEVWSRNAGTAALDALHRREGDPITAPAISASASGRQFRHPLALGRTTFTNELMTGYISSNNDLSYDGRVRATSAHSVIAGWRRRTSFKRGIC